ncbi:rubrerythrin [Bacillus mycoides]
MYVFLSNNDDTLYRQNDKHIRSIEKAINGEYSAIHFYARLATLAPDINERTQILEIRQDEQRTVDFYLEIADKTTNQQVKETFRRAAADEQNHAVWFLYYFSKQNKTKNEIKERIHALIWNIVSFLLFLWIRFMINIIPLQKFL